MRLTIVVGPIYSTISPMVPPTAYIELRQMFSIRIKGAWFDPRVRAGMWDGRIHYFETDGRFYTGLLPQVADILEAHGHRLTFRDERRRVVPGAIRTDGSRLRLFDYQQPIVETAVRAARGVIHAATASGKTEMAIAITAALRVRTLFMVPGTDLLRQTVARYRAAMPAWDVGTITGHDFRPGFVTVANVQAFFDPAPRHEATARQRKRHIRADIAQWLATQVDCVFADEVHLMTSLEWSKILKACPAYYRYGLSATPHVEDPSRNVLLTALTGETIGRVTRQELEARARAARPTVRVVAYRATAIVRDRFRSFGHDYRMLIVEHAGRNDAIAATVAKVAPRRTLVLVVRYEHADRILERLAARGLGDRAQFLSGKVAGEDRLAGIAQFRSGAAPILLATRIFNVGLDIKEIDALVIAGAGASANQTVQQVGRAIRARPDKATVDIYDFEDVGLYAGEFDADEKLRGKKWIEKHYRQRLRTYTREGIDVTKEENFLK